MRRLILCLVLILLLGSQAGAQDSNDVLSQILNEVGYTRADLGHEPKGYWSRFPLDAPHKLGSFDDLFAEPLKLYDYSGTMANAVEMYLDSTFADTSYVSLYKLVHILGVDRKLGGFRSYSANLIDPPNDSMPILAAIDRIYRMYDQNPEVMSFGTKHKWPPHREPPSQQLKLLPDTVRSIIAGLIVNLGEASRWRDIAFRRCDRTAMEQAYARRDLADTQGDGQVYYPEMDDIAATIDLASLHYAALKTAAAVGWAECHLARIEDPLPEKFYMTFPTPIGRVVIIAPGHRGQLDVAGDDCLLVVDLGQDCHYHGTIGANHSLLNPISVVLDMAGDDVYGHENQFNPVNSGVGLLGVGLVLDRSGDDEYHGSRFSQGAGLFGVGVLLDRFGDDSFKAEASAQGCGYFGIGLCFDGTGNDMYYLHGDGQGMGGVGGGVGVLASFSGKDYYTAEPFVSIAGPRRADYHSDHKIIANNAQGAAAGRRGDGSDGHSWAGGMGALIDIHGDDNYLAGNFSLGIGYWFGTGIVVDRFGNDTYKSCYFTQASGAHFCNGALIDENGDDTHELFETAGAGLAFGWDFANALFVDKGGDDKYSAKMISLGLSQIRSCALFVDIGGDDQYKLGIGTAGLGEASFREDYRQMHRLSPYFNYGRSFGGFIDIGGNDEYLEFDKDQTIPHAMAKDGGMWFQPGKADSTFGYRNFGVGIDAATGTVPDLYIWDNLWQKEATE